MESLNEKNGLTPDVLNLIKRLKKNEAQEWCDVLSVIMDRIILMDNEEDPPTTLRTLKTLQSIKRILKQFT